MMKASVVAVLAAMTGCATMGNVGMQRADLAAGRWNGSISRDGSQRPLFLDIAGGSGAYRGEARSAQEEAGMMLKDVDVRGDEVRLDTDSLRFVGHLRGSTLSGTVVALPAGAPAGEFSVTWQEPNRSESPFSGYF